MVRGNTPPGHLGSKLGPTHLRRWTDFKGLSTDTSEASAWSGISNICSVRYVGQLNSCGLNMSHSIFRDVAMREWWHVQTLSETLQLIDKVNVHFYLRWSWISWECGEMWWDVVRCGASSGFTSTSLVQKRRFQLRLAALHGVWRPLFWNIHNWQTKPSSPTQIAGCDHPQPALFLIAVF